MRTVLTIALYDLLRSSKQRETYLIGALMPAMMMVLLGVALGGADSATITVDVIDQDGSDLSAQFVALLGEEMAGGEDDESFRLCVYAPQVTPDCGLDDDLAQRPDDWSSTADDRLEATDTYAVLIIPAGFGAALRSGESVTVAYKNSAALSAPTLAEQKIDAALSRMGGSVAVASLLVDVAAAEFSRFEADQRPAVFDAACAQIEAAWDARPIRIETDSTRSTPSLVGFNQSGPGIATMFVLIWMLNASSALIYEREHGTLQRLYALPHRRATILGGKLLGHYLFGVIQFALLILFGALVGVEWGTNIPGIALTAVIYTLATIALGMALATIVRTSAQASNISLLLGLTLAPLGGAWWPLEIVPDFMRAVGHLSPVAWGMDAFQEMMFYGGGLLDIAPMLGVLLLMAAAFFTFGVFNFKYE